MLKIVKNEGIKTVAYRARQGARRKADEDKRYARLLKKGVIVSGRQIKFEDLGKFAEKLVNIDLITDEGFLSDNIKESEKEYIAIVEKGVILRDDALLYVDGLITAKKNRGEEIDIFYTDEDKIDDRKRRCNPIFKPEFSPDTLLSFNYIGDFWCAKKDLVLAKIEEVNGKTANITELKYELLLRMIIGEKAVANHVECVAVTKSLDDYISNDCNDMKKRVFDSIGFEYAEINKYNNVYPVNEKPLVSIIIPTKDHPELLRQCVDSIVTATKYDNYELVIVDNGSLEDNKNKNVELLDLSGAPYMYVYKPMDFNFSAMCNTGASKANGDYFLFLNDDIEVVKVPGEYDWLTVLLGQAMRSWSGAVGAKLYYPEKKEYQHLGIIQLREYGFDHIYGRFPVGTDMNCYRDVAMYNYIAVTGACIMISKEKFMSVGGFNIDLAITHNDVDLCLKLYENGLYTVIRNDVELIHHESSSRGADSKDEESLINNLTERDKLLKLHPWINRYDPFYSRLYTSEELDCGINANIYIVKRALLKKSDMDVSKLAHMDFNVAEEDKPSDEKAALAGIKAEIAHAKVYNNLRISGYVYTRNASGKAKPIINPQLVVYNKDNCYTVKANSVCDRTFNKQIGLEENINFAPFVCEADLSTVDFEKGVYRVAVLYKGEIIGDSYRLENL